MHTHTHTHTHTQTRTGDKEEFYRLNHVYLDFDEAVHASVLYKYQHVGDWYIVACPNAAEPFDEPGLFCPYSRSLLPYSRVSFDTCSVP